MKKILITGGSGFIGSHLTRFLHNKGYKIASVFETDGEDIVIFDDELGSSFHKIAYIIVDSNLDLEKKALDYFKANDDGFISFTDRTEGYMAGYKQAIEDLKQK